jgi:hypothetical protein
MIDVESPRRSSVALTMCRRASLIDGFPPGGGPGRSFLNGLKAFDRGLELYWHPLRKRWVLYRVVQRAAARSDDLLIKEAVVEGPRGEYRSPGPWLLEILRKWDKTRGGSVDPERGNREFLKGLDAADRKKQEAEDRVINEASEVTTAEMVDRIHHDRYTREVTPK